MKTLNITLSSKQTSVQPVPRRGLAAFIRHLGIIQSIWIEEGFSTADAILREDCWAEMKAAAAMLPHADSPAILGIDLDALSNDYEQLERLFFGDARDAYNADYLNVDSAIADFKMELFKGCALYELHHFEPKKKLVEANRLRLERNPIAKSKPKTSRSKAAATPKRTRSQTSSTASERKTA